MTGTNAHPRSANTVVCLQPDARNLISSYTVMRNSIPVRARMGSTPIADTSQISAPQQHERHIRDKWPYGRYDHGFAWRLMPLTVEALAAMGRAQSRHSQSHFYG